MSEIDIRDGDIFRWTYKSEKLNSESLSYWAKSCIAVAKDGLLRDTYWHSASDGAVFQYTDVGTRIELEFIANFDAIEQISDGEATYYADADVVNLNHGNSPEGNCYRRKGTSRSRDVMIAKVERSMERAQSELRSAQRDIERLRETRTSLDGGATLDGVWI